MSFGKMTSRIQIAKAATAKDKYGFEAQEYTVLADVRAYAEPLRGYEQWANMAVFSSEAIKFRFRFIPGLAVTPSLFIIFNGKRYRPASVENVRNRGRYWEVYAGLWEPKVG